jgi:UDP-N-acetylmuramate dehydrogenase
LDDLSRIIKYARRKKIPFFVIGFGSNLLVNDKGFKGMVIRLNSDFFKEIKVQGNTIFARSGAGLNKIIQIAKQNLLGGCEFLSGIPGSLGGAIMMNAGARCNRVFNNPYQSIGDLIQAVEVMDSNGRIKTFKKDKLKFGYRQSNLIKYVIISARLRLKQKKTKEIQQEIDNFLRYKSSTQELKLPSAGCVFKNPRIYSKNIFSKPVLSAGYLIEASGLKKYRIGQAAISDKHANYIVNLKNAKASDVIAIIKYVQKKIKEKFNLSLEPEIKII